MSLRDTFINIDGFSRRGSEVMSRIRLPKSEFASWLHTPLAAFLILLMAYLMLSAGAFSVQAYLATQEQAFLSLNHGLNLAPAKLWSNLTLLGDGLVLFPLFSVVLIWHHRAWLSLWAAVPFAAVFSLVGKKYFDMPRPASVLDHGQFYIIGDSVSAHTSFPSGHSITIFTALVAILCAALPTTKTNATRTLVLLSVSSVGLILCASRIAVGAHWPFDILAGAILGWIAGVCGSTWVKRQWSSTACAAGTNTGKVTGILLLFWSLSLAQTAIDTNFDQIILVVAALCGVISSMFLLFRHAPAQPDSTPAKAV